MAEISATQVKELRDATNVSMMECKKALVEAGGDMEKATKLLRERGMAVAAKRASKEANQGIIASESAPDGKTVSMVEVNCETDFVARNEDFKAFVKSAAVKALAVDNVAEALNDELMAKIAAVGENMRIRRNVRYILTQTGRLASYIHLGGKVGVLVELGCAKDETVASPVFDEVARDLTLQIAAANPRYLTAADVPAAEIASEREIYAKQVADKPAPMIEQIVMGKVKKFCSEVCLVDQPFVKDPKQKQTVTDMLKEKGKQLGDSLTVRRFVRYQLGA